MAITVRGTSSFYGFAGATTTLALPTGTEIGDYLVLCVTTDVPPTDNRLTAITDNVWTGVATHLADLSVVASTGYWSAAAAAFLPLDLTGETDSIAGSGGVGFPMPSVDAPAAIAGLAASYSVVDGSIAPPEGYQTIVSTGPGKAHSSLAIWHGTPPSPPEDVTGGAWPSNVGWAVTTIGVQGVIAPPARLFPRADHLGVGSGRIWPPAGTRQSGRLNGPY